MTRSLDRAVLQRFALVSVGSTTLIASSAPMFLQLPDALRDQASPMLLGSGLLGGVLALGAALAAQRRVARAARLLDSGKARRATVNVVRRQATLLTFSWMLAHCAGLLVFVTPWRPRLMSLASGVTLTLLSALVVIAAALPLNAMLRSLFAGLLERVPPDLMRRVVHQASDDPRAAGRINRRIAVAVSTPMLLVSVGAALIANAHLRQAQELSRRETALLIARASFALSDDPNTQAGVGAALLRARHLGFEASFSHKQKPIAMERTEAGTLELTTPVEGGSATLRFAGSTLEIASLETLLIAVFGVVAAALLGFMIGGVLTSDLARATRYVQSLGTEQVLGGSAIVERPARFRIVAELERAIQRLAARFRMFAEAQEDAIEAREVSTRMRGLFFASVSHDLKSPLNSILGFTDLVRLETLREGQLESLDAIHSRGLELLALIETILDAARVEAGQLSLMFSEEPFMDVYELALSRAGQLGGSYGMQIFDDIEPSIPPLLVDRGRIARAIATFIAYSVRATKGGKMWVRAEMETRNLLRIDVDVPSHLHSPDELESMLAPTGSRGQRHHRGLALGLRLARAVVELHQGAVRVIDRGEKGAMFCIILPTARPSTRPPRLESEPPHRLAAEATPVGMSPSQQESEPATNSSADELTVPDADAADEASLASRGANAAGPGDATPGDALPAAASGTSVGGERTQRGLGRPARDASRSAELTSDDPDAPEDDP